MEKREVLYCTSTEIEQLIRDNFPVDAYDFKDTESLRPGEAQIFTVVPTPEPDWQEDIDSIEAGYVPLYETGLALNLLHQKGVIEGGMYVVEVL